jgi:hypothetical protein
MSAIASREMKLGNLLKCEYGATHGYCREAKTVTLTPTSAIGDVLYTASGKGVLVDQANTASADGILVEPTLYTLRPKTGTLDVVAAVLVRGPAIVADGGLKFNADINTAAEKTALYAVLEGLGILVRKQV